MMDFIIEGIDVDYIYSGSDTEMMSDSPCGTDYSCSSGCNSYCNCNCNCDQN